MTLELLPKPGAESAVLSNLCSIICMNCESNSLTFGQSLSKRFRRTDLPAVQPLVLQSDLQPRLQMIAPASDCVPPVTVVQHYSVL